MTGVKKLKPRFEITNQRRDPSAEGVATEDIEGEIPRGTSGSIAAREAVAVDITAQALGTDRHPAPLLSSEAGRARLANDVWRSWDV